MLDIFHMKIEPKRPNYTVRCMKCEKPVLQCDCEEHGLAWDIDDEALDSPTRGQAKENNRKVTR